MRLEALLGPLASLAVGYLTLFHAPLSWQLSAISVGFVAGILSVRVATAAASSLVGSLPFLAVLSGRVLDGAGMRLLELMASIAGLQPSVILGLLVLSYVGIAASSSAVVSVVSGAVRARLGRGGKDQRP